MENWKISKIESFQNIRNIKIFESTTQFKIRRSSAHSKSRTFENQPLLVHLKSRQVQISDPHCGGGLISSKDTEMN